MNERPCPECGRQIYGRADKRYCSDSCRNAYNNRIKADNYNLIRNINNLLARNRRVLESLNPEGKTRISRERLLRQGFDFTYFTHIYRTRAGDEYRFCYEQGYLDIGDGFYLLVRRGLE
ncbi:MAG: hypothetical protein OEY56_14270 [Cyclobacteriaceae bacterium]|nr:hypothetical protein [Cyclobacteriaceae bacterium]